MGSAARSRPRERPKSTHDGLQMAREARPKRAPRATQDSSRWSQDGPEAPPEGPRVPLRGPSRGPQEAKIISFPYERRAFLAHSFLLVLAASNTAQEAPKIAPRRATMPPKRPQDGLRETQHGPRGAPDGLRGRQEGEFELTFRALRPKSSPETASRPPEAPEGPQEV